MSLCSMAPILVCLWDAVCLICSKQTGQKALLWSYYGGEDLRFEFGLCLCLLMEVYAHCYWTDEKHR